MRNFKNLVREDGFWVTENIELIQDLLKNPEELDTTEYVEGIFIASENGHAEVVKLLLNQGFDFDLKYGVEDAAMYGHIEIVLSLLEAPKGRPALAFLNAAECGHIDIVKLLLNHPKVIPAAKNNYAIKKASQYGYIDIVICSAFCRHTPLKIAA